VLTLVRQARQRLLHNGLLAEGANAFCAALLAFILLLLAGTEILDWRIAAAIPVAAAAVGIFRARKRLPSEYAVAQIVDHRADLADTLSTALYFSQSTAKAHASSDVRACQWAHAERLSGSVDVRAVIPYLLPRALYAAGALLLVASSLFALRYGLSRRLDLKAPLANILQQSFGFERREVAKNHQRPKTLQPLPAEDESTENAAQQDPLPGGDEDANADLTEQTEDLKSMAKNTKSTEGKQQEGGEKNAADDQEGEGEGREGSDPANSKPGNENGKNAGQKQSGGQQQENAGDSLWNRMKDGFQNLLSRMKQQPNNPGAQQQASASQDSKQGSKGQQSGGKQQSRDGEQQAGNQQGESDNSQSGDEAQNAQDAASKSQGKSDEKQASKQPGSGIGSQDGSKDIRQAEQLAAMGKISEIFGKRSQNISGEATVEVQNTAQQLRTPYAQRGAQHTQGGAEINRDEVPVALQGYVEQYFEQVRKQKKP
jgi:hypothetical protein